jgi:hypothetical protein
MAGKRVQGLHITDRSRVNEYAVDIICLYSSFKLLTQSPESLSAFTENALHLCVPHYSLTASQALTSAVPYEV